MTHKSPSSLTSISLLGRLRGDSDNEDAWRAFVEEYAPRVLAWCRQWDLQPADAEDVTQTVLLKLTRVMVDFQYDPAMSFRGWLKTVTQRTVTDFFRQQGRRELATGGSEATQRMHNEEAREDLLARLRESFETELLEAAMDAVRARVTPQRWQAYELTAMEGRNATEVANQLGMKVATVYTAKHKIQNMLKQEIQALEESPASEMLSLSARPN